MSVGLEPGTVVGRDFRVVRHLASGAMGSVYVVEQLSTGKQRALKVMAMELGSNDRARERFVLEARIGSHIDSDHVVEVIAAGIDEHGGHPYIVMELLRGEELADLVARVGRLGVAEVAEILKQTGHALERAHAQGIVHRDLKPENLFIAESRREGVPFTVKILDFGIAKLVAERTAEGTQPVGTPLFMSPEQTDRRGRIGPQSDVWPLGLIAFYLLTGNHYWQAWERGITALLREVVMDPLVPASQRAAAYGAADLLPPGFDAWFAGCVERDVDRRFPEAGVCVRAFEALVGAAVTAGGTGPITTRIGATDGRQDTSVQLPAFGAAATQAATGPIVPTVGRSTGLTAASSMDASTATPPKSRAGLAVGAIAVLALAGGGVWLATRGGDDPAATVPPAPTVTAAPTAAATASAPGCPKGMVLVPGGNMFMGSTDADLEPDVRPPHKVTVSAVCLDLKEVTVAEYDRCATDGNCLRPQAQVAFEGAGPREVEQFSKLCNSGRADRQDHPINCVDWSMAKNFCETKGGRLPEGGARLPTEAEWEFAARGSSQRVYPWGDETPGPTRLNACGDECLGWLKGAGLQSFGKMFDGNDGHADTAPVGSYAAGASSAGILDLAGNVWEWTADWYGPYGDAEQTDPKGPDGGKDRVVRGGGFNGMKPQWAKPAYRWKTAPSTRSHGIGFRCAAPPR
jgi:formylglycine-generating enzyme required for sulfatase activity/tRNA A-37 threonylcarbamoyl transferase component Bud32